MTVIEMIRAIGPEFGTVTDETLSQYVLIFRPMVSRKQFGNLYQQGLAFLICHKLKMAGYGENPLEELGKIGATGFGVSSVSEGGSSISFAANQSSNLAPDAELALTSYGLQFLQIRRSVIVPIHVSGEPIEPVPPYDDSELSVIPVASATKLGGVRIRDGSGLGIGEDGSIFVIGAPGGGGDG